MVRHENEKGSVNVSTNVYTDIVGTAATNCFGVKGMAARSLKDGVYHLLRKESVGKGHQNQNQQLSHEISSFSQQSEAKHKAKL